MAVFFSPASKPGAQQLRELLGLDALHGLLRCEEPLLPISTATRTAAGPVRFPPRVCKR
jgi:hypothetical protein